MNQLPLRCAFLALVCASCAPLDEVEAVQASETGSLTQPILNGDAMPTNALWPAVFANGDWCSSTLLRNDWVLTAGHCVTPTNVANPSSVLVAQSTTVYSVADQVVMHPKAPLPGHDILTDRYPVDVALIHLKHGLPVGAVPFRYETLAGGDFGLETKFFSGDPATLVGQQVRCFGYGPDGGPTLKSGDFIVKNYEGGGFRYGKNSRAQLHVKGDSGGSCFIDTVGGPLLVSVHSWQTDTHAWGSAAPTFRDWLMDTIYAKPSFENTFAEPLPNGFSTSKNWDPCSGQCFTWQADVSLEANKDYAHVAGTAVTGTGRVTGRACGNAMVSLSTDAVNQSTGIQSLRATCDVAVHCHGTACATSPGPLPNHAYASARFDPCNGTPFRWTARAALEPSWDYGYVDGQALTGWAATRSGVAYDATDVLLHTDPSVASQSFRVEAECPVVVASSFQIAQGTLPNLRIAR